MAEIIKDLLRRGRDIFLVGLERSAEGSQVRKAFFLGDRQHLRLNAVNLTQAELVNLIRRHVRGGAAVDIVLVALLAVWQRADRKRGAALRSVFFADELGKLFVSRENVVINSVG